MEQERWNVVVNKPRITWEQNEETGQLRDIARISFDVVGLPPKLLRALAYAAVFEQRANLTVQLVQQDFPGGAEAPVMPRPSESLSKTFESPTGGVHEKLEAEIRAQGL